MSAPLTPEKQLAIEQAFSPSSPISERNLFAGRLTQIDEVVESINERGQQVIVYGERGVGKTSFANIVVTHISGMIPAKVTCNRTDSFRDIWQKAFAKIRFEHSKEGVGFIPNPQTQEYQLDFFLPEAGEVSSLDIQQVLEHVECNLLFIFDEFDTVEREGVRAQMADALKALSDNAPRVTVMLVGVGEDVKEIIGEHDSVRRCLRQVKLPRMSFGELGEILDRGASSLGVKFQDSVRKRVVRFSQGFPHYTHLLGKFASKSCLELGESEISDNNLGAAIGASVRRVDEIVRLSYQKATISSRNSDRFRAVVWACANTREDEHGCFSMSQITEEYLTLTGGIGKTNITYYVSSLCLCNRGQVLEKIGSSPNLKYRFRNPLLRSYVSLMRESTANQRRER